MATNLEKLLEEVRSLSQEERGRVRAVLDEELSCPKHCIETAERISALNELRKRLSALPVHNLPDGFSNRDHDRMLGATPA